MNRGLIIFTAEHLGKMKKSATFAQTLRESLIKGFSGSLAVAVESGGNDSYQGIRFSDAASAAGGGRL
jgi:hypothetical protein